MGAVAHQVPEHQGLVHAFISQGLEGRFQGGEVGVDVREDPQAHRSILS
ncbi:hypothetical protein TSC_c19540 [Thermus scotoductus SA-01]|uniref:Uncharacterized protein n=1 Tax=Thermus scotoductus (strain ATCC 700910 / SA-01) TaxID=743525 RepID=E8PMV2_THESS|nr:hypothetical protein TSC_c19540 [Thermus scotoductus SA-01]